MRPGRRESQLKIGSGLNVLFGHSINELMAAGGKAGHQSWALSFVNIFIKRIFILAWSLFFQILIPHGHDMNFSKKYIYFDDNGRCCLRVTRLFSWPQDETWITGIFVTVSSILSRHTIRKCRLCQHWEIVNNAKIALNGFLMSSSHWCEISGYF